MAWHVRSKQATDQELGGDDVDWGGAHAYRLKLIRKLGALGLKGVVEPVTSVSDTSSSCS